MRILITGAKGQLGYDLQKVFAKDGLFLFDLPKWDICEKTQIEKAIRTFKPEVIIHAAAYTQVDQAETDKKTCLKVNQIGTQNIVKAAKKIAAKMVYISTDYVFDGKAKGSPSGKNQPYSETDKPHPLNVYGRSKLAGERAVQKNLKNYLIVRSAWLYGPARHRYAQALAGGPSTGQSTAGKKNFVQKILEAARQKPKLQVVSDQTGSPTYTFHLARKIKELLAKNKTGLYHVTNQGQASWFDFAKEILKIVNIKTPIEPAKTSQFPAVAKRPKFSVLANDQLKKEKICLLPSWRTGIREYLKEIL